MTRKYYWYYRIRKVKPKLMSLFDKQSIKDMKGYKDGNIMVAHRKYLHIITDTPEQEPPKLDDPFTVSYKGRVIYRFTHQATIAYITARLLTSKQ